MESAFKSDNLDRNGRFDEFKFMLLNQKCQDESNGG
jgi:hypothetical protein